jgi:hypothetical protein
MNKIQLLPEVEFYDDIHLFELGKRHLDFNARWIHDFDVTNRVEGNGFNFTASLKF